MLVLLSRKEYGKRRVARRVAGRVGGGAGKGGVVDIAVSRAKGDAGTSENAARCFALFRVEWLCSAVIIIFN